MKSLTPNFFVDNMHNTIDFYQQLGFVVNMRVPEEGNDPVWVMMNVGSVDLMFQTKESLKEELPEISRISGGSLLLYIQMTGIRSLFAKCHSMGIVLKGLEKTFYGATEFSVLDINGYVLTFSEDEVE